MPDGDIFARSLPRNWRKAARLAFGAEDDAAAIDACEKELARDLNERPWNGVGEAVRDIAAAMTADDDPVNRRRVLKHLEWRRDKWPADRYEAMRRVANRNLARGTATDGSASPKVIVGSRETRIAVEIFEESIVMSIAPACHAERLAKAGKMTVDQYHERTLEIRTLLRNSPVLQGLVNQVMRTPGNASPRVRAPRNRSPRLPQRELVNLPIG